MCLCDRLEIPLDSGSDTRRLPGHVSQDLGPARRKRTWMTNSRRAWNGESSASSSENFPFRGHTLWEMCRYPSLECAITTGSRTLHRVRTDARRHPRWSAQIGRHSSPQRLQMATLDICSGQMPLF